MCRNARIPTRKSLEKYIGDLVHTIPEYQPCENANSFDHPEIPIMREWGKVELAIWGLVPEWVQPGDFDRAKAMMDATRNAKAETIFEKASFAESIRQRRCLLFLEGFYEWQHMPKASGKGKETKRHYVSMKDGSIFACGGVWSEWRDERLGKTLVTCSMITTAANPLMAEIHNSGERQPLILPRTSWERWLQKDLVEREIQELMQVFPEDGMQAVLSPDSTPPESPGGSSSGDEGGQGALF